MAKLFLAFISITVFGISCTEAGLIISRNTFGGLNFGSKNCRSIGNSHYCSGNLDIHVSNGRVIVNGEEIPQNQDGVVRISDQDETNLETQKKLEEDMAEMQRVLEEAAEERAKALEEAAKEREAALEKASKIREKAAEERQKALEEAAKERERKSFERS